MSHLLRPKDIVRFSRNVSVSNRGCWEWIGGVSRNGYPEFHVEKTTLRGPRAFFKFHTDYEVEGLEMHHLCHNILCVNPSHVTAVTKMHHIQLHPNGLGMINKRKTHCKNGHEFNTTNTIFYSDNHGRQCRLCNSSRYRVRRQRIKEGTK